MNNDVLNMVFAVHCGLVAAWTVHQSSRPAPPAACDHAQTVPVTISTGETVARICLTCDAQIPAGR